MELEIIKTELLHEYLKVLPKDMQQVFEGLHDAELSTPNFSFYTSVASVYSSKIEGEQIELDSYIKHKRDGISFEIDYTKKTDDLYSAYTFAQAHDLNENNVALAHTLLSKHIVSAMWQGKYRQQNMYVASEDGKIEYVAALPSIVELEMKKFFNDLQILLAQKMSIEEVFYFAAMLHLVFVKIHPWNDGNGRSARLIEKWFLAEKLGKKAWFLQSEKMYYQHHNLYYQNLRQLGLEYESLNYDKALPFLQMLAGSLINN